MVGRVGFEPTMLSRDWIMSPGPATNTASGPLFLYCTTELIYCQALRSRPTPPGAVRGSGVLVAGSCAAG